MVTRVAAPLKWKVPRRHPRVDLVMPVELRTAQAIVLGESQNVSLGGLLVSCRESFDRSANISVLFNLPSGNSIRGVCEVVHIQPGLRMGLRFLELDEESRQALSPFIRALLGYARRGRRIAKRFYVSMKLSGAEESQIEVAETVVLSLHGGLLACRAHFKAGDKVFLWWPDGKRGGEARIVDRRAQGGGGLVELGFEFCEHGNFWGIDFGEEN